MMLRAHRRMVRVSSFTLMGNSSALIREQPEFCDYLCVVLGREGKGKQD